jgi:hypothetical protein
MKRRSILAGAGLFVGTGGFALGTGAFTSVSAERSISIDTASDAQAFLRLDPNDPNYPNSAYATESDGMVKIDISAGSEGNFNGTGVSPFASTVLGEVLPIENQGTQDVRVSVASESLSPGDPLELFATSVPGRSGRMSLLEGASGDRPIIAPGESFALGFAIDAETKDKVETLEDEIFDGDGLQVTITASAEEVPNQ